MTAKLQYFPNIHMTLTRILTTPTLSQPPRSPNVQELGTKQQIKNI